MAKPRRGGGRIRARGRASGPNEGRTHRWKAPRTEEALAVDAARGEAVLARPPPKDGDRVTGGVRGIVRYRLFAFDKDQRANGTLTEGPLETPARAGNMARTGRGDREATTVGSAPDSRSANEQGSRSVWQFPKARGAPSMRVATRGLTDGLRSARGHARIAALKSTRETLENPPIRGVLEK